MPPGKLDNVVRSGFARFVASHLQPGVLHYGRIEWRGALHDGIKFGCTAALGHQELNADHRSVAHAAVELIEAGLKIVRIEVYKAIRAIGPAFDGAQHLIVFLAELRGRRIHKKWISEREHDPLD